MSLEGKRLTKGDKRLLTYALRFLDANLSEEAWFFLHQGEEEPGFLEEEETEDVVRREMYLLAEKLGLEL